MLKISHLYGKMAKTTEFDPDRNLIQFKAKRFTFSQERNVQGAVTFVFANFGSACTRNVGM